MRYLFILLSSILIFSSCKIYRSNLMLKTPKDFTYDKLVDSLSRADYKIAVNDIIAFRVTTNNGHKLVENLTTVANNTNRSEIEATVESDGYVKIPLLGRVNINGLTIKEAENVLEQKYTEFYVEPYVNIRITNKRVIVFPGGGGTARVLTLTNNNTSVIEAIATAGGIVEDGKAYKVKLIRSNPDPQQKPLVYLMDLSEIAGITAGRSIVQAGDIIYVEPRYRPLATFNREITPVITLVTSMFILYQFSRIVK